MPSIRPDIRYPAITGTGYPAITGYPISGYWISRISGRPDIRQKQYPVHPYPVAEFLSSRHRIVNNFR
jgi:hypothetical protein